jgi:hypothetical protein
VVEAVGASVTLEPTSDPGIQLYDVAPDPFNVTVDPVQIAALEAEAATVGSALTLTATVAVFTQPFALVPVTVYVVFADGATLTEVPVNDPGIQV